MTPQTRILRVGWLAVLLLCATLYAVLHLKVTTVQSDVVNAERKIVELENINLLLETDYLTRSSQVQLAVWNRVDFGFVAPTAEQFIESERQLASFGSPRALDAPAPIMLAGLSGDEELPEFPKLVSPLTGAPMDERLLSAEPGDKVRHAEDNPLARTTAQAPVRIVLSARVRAASE